MYYANKRTRPADHNHYSDLKMSTMASQITSHTIIYSTVYSCADQIKHQSSASHRWIPRTNCQLRGKCFHWMTSSFAHIIDCTSTMETKTQWPQDIDATDGRIWFYNHPRQTITENYDNNGKDEYFRFDDDNKMNHGCSRNALMFGH